MIGLLTSDARSVGDFFMPRHILKIKNYYLEWSTIVDAPITYGMPLNEFIDYYQGEYGASGMIKLADRLKRVEEKGTTAIQDKSLQDTIQFNRAGDNETELSFDEIFKIYCLNRPKE